MINKKIKKAASLKNIVKRLKRKGKKIVFTNGCFDILHLGHVKYLEQAKKSGDILIVALNSDKSARKLKGKFRPINSQQERAGVIAALESVDYVAIFSQLTPLVVIKQLEPDILIKGSDWKTGSIVGSDIVNESGGKVLRAKFLKNYSTTKLIKKIAKKYHKR